MNQRVLPLALKKRVLLRKAAKETIRGRGMVIEPKRLTELWIYTNNSCNLKCKHCLVSAGEEEKDKLSATDIIRVVDEAKSLGVRRFYFTGGEPFLRHDIFTLINYITKDRGACYPYKRDAPCKGEGREISVN